ncbi:MAG TPA: hypothetical protein VHL08_02750 [Dongiaceae bacterium]|jgi:hypothetical protein|nr:hypothetical protein [Dongiaceae bacterium]
MGLGNNDGYGSQPGDQDRDLSSVGNNHSHTPPDPEHSFNKYGGRPGWEMHEKDPITNQERDDLTYGEQIGKVPPNVGFGR